MASVHRKPIELKKLTGTFRPDKSADNPVEHERIKKIPPCDINQITNPEAQRYYYEVAQIIINNNMFYKDVTTQQLHRYCAAYELFLQAWKSIRNDGIQYVTDSGGIKRNPALITQKEASIDMYRFEDRYGLSPSKRGSVEAGPQRNKEENTDSWGLPKLVANAKN